MVQLSELLSEITEKTRNSTSGALDNTKRTRAINRVLEDLQDFGDWNFTKRTKSFYLIEGINEYSIFSHVGATCQDNDGSTIISDFKNPYDLRPLNQSGISLGYNDVKMVRENIRRCRNIYEYAVDNGLLIINYPRQSSRTLHKCDSITGDGTWSVSGDATNLTLDTIIFSEGTGSLNFDVSTGTSLVLTNSDFTLTDLQSFQNKAHLTLDAWLPTITNFTSIKVRLGSSSGSYWEKTETLPAGSRELVVGKNTFAFRWATSSETGTPDYENVDYIQVTITYSGSTTATDFRLDNIRIGEETEMELDYYSLAMVKDAAGDYQLEFNPDAVTMTDELLGGVTARPTVSIGAIHECFEMIGGKSERDRTDSWKKYDIKKTDLRKRAGNRIRRPSKILNFPGRQQGKWTNIH